MLDALGDDEPVELGPQWLELGQALALLPVTAAGGEIAGAGAERQAAGAGATLLGRPGGGRRVCVEEVQRHLLAAGHETKRVAEAGPRGGPPVRQLGRLLHGAEAGGQDRLADLRDATHDGVVPAHRLRGGRGRLLDLADDGDDVAPGHDRERLVAEAPPERYGRGLPDDRVEIEP